MSELFQSFQFLEGQRRRQVVSLPETLIKSADSKSGVPEDAMEARSISREVL